MFCLYCSRGDVPVEIFGFAVHKRSDRWIACAAVESCTPFYDGVIATRDDPKEPRPVTPDRAGKFRAESKVADARLH